MPAGSTGSSYHHIGKDVCTDVWGNCYTTGYYNTPGLGFGASVLGSNGQDDSFLAKYDPSGNLVWVRGFGGPIYDLSESVCTDNAGNVYVAGWFNSGTMTVGNTTLQGYGDYDVFVIRYDAAGNVQWAKAFGGSGTEYPPSLAADASGNIYVTGDFASATMQFDAITITGMGSKDIYVAKLNGAGTVLWAKDAGGTAIDNANAICTTAAGEVLITGAFNSASFSFGNYTAASGGTMVAYVVKLDANGNDVWLKTLGGTGHQRSFSVCEGVSGTFYITGSFKGNLFSPVTAMNANPATDDLFIGRFDAAGNLAWMKTAGNTDDDAGHCVSADAVGNVYLTAGSYNINYSGNYGPVTFGNLTFTPAFQDPDPLYVVRFDIDGNPNCGTMLTSGGYAYSGTTLTRIATDMNGDAWLTGTELNPNFTVGSFSFAQYGKGAAFFAKLHCDCALALSSGTPNYICEGSTAMLTAAGAVHYHWSTGDTASVIYVSPAVTTTYSVVASYGSCSDTLYLTVNVVPRPQLETSADTVIEAGGTAQLFVTANENVTYQWSPAGGLSCDDCATPFASPASPVEYCVTATDSSGCRSVACVNVRFPPECPVYIPNAFSPNGDGENDLFRVRSECLRKQHLSVYDRWGNRVFDTREAGGSWDGTYLGQMLENDVFTWVFEGELTNGSTVSRSGNVSLVR